MRYQAALHAVIVYIGSHLQVGYLQSLAWRVKPFTPELLHVVVPSDATAPLSYATSPTPVGIVVRFAVPQRLDINNLFSSIKGRD